MMTTTTVTHPDGTTISVSTIASPVAALAVEVPGFIVGSYATSPNLYALEHPPAPCDAEREAAYYTGLDAIASCSGLEIQLDGKGSMHCFDEDTFLSTFARPRWRGVLTCIGGTMGNVGGCAQFGLASTDAAGRAKAIEFARAALAAVGRWNARQGGACGKMAAVQVHSAPNTTKEGASASAEAFAESLVELMSWDWQGAELVVEHCDAPAAHPASKGFLTLEQELQALKIANAKGSDKNGSVGVSINWARSVLETRSVDTPLQHVALAKAQGVLRGIMFSGCTPDESSPYGPWKDCHMPHAPTPGAEFAAEGSLMTVEQIRKTLSAAAGASLKYCGCKITSLHTGMWVGDATDDTPARVGVNRDLLCIVAEALAAAGQRPAL